MKTMRAAVVVEPKNLQIQDVPVPACAANQLLVKIRKACFCNETDWQIYNNTSPFNGEEWFHKYPSILGHESMGEVAKIGSEVKGYEIGDRIAWYFAMNGAFAEYIAITPSELAIVKLDDSISDAEGALFEPYIGTMRGIYAANVRPYENVVIMGQGAMGLLLLQELKALGVNKVVCTDILDSRLAFSKKFGADLTVNVDAMTRDEAVELIKRKIGDIDIIIDAIGDDLSKEKQSTNLGVKVVRTGGRYMIYGFPAIPRTFDMTAYAGKRLSGMYIADCPLEITRKMAAIAFRLVKEGKVDLKSMVTHSFAFDDMLEGLKFLNAQPEKVIKVVVDIA